MPYSVPTPMDLNDKLNLVYKRYVEKKGRPNDKRHELINFVTSFQYKNDKKYNHYAAIGACLYALLVMEDESHFLNWFRSPDKMLLYKLINGCLEVNSHSVLNDYEMVTFLFYFYRHVEKYPRKTNGTFTDRKEDIVSLLQNIEYYIKKFLHEILKSPPTYKNLCDHFNKIPESYTPRKGLLGWWKTDDTRIQDIKRIEIIKENVNFPPQGTSEEKWLEKAYKIRYGALLYIMSKIESSYRLHYLWSPSNSSLYRV